MATGQAVNTDWQDVPPPKTLNVGVSDEWQDYDAGSAAAANELARVGAKDQNEQARQRITRIMPDVHADLLHPKTGQETLRELSGDPNARIGSDREAQILGGGMGLALGGGPIVEEIAANGLRAAVAKFGASLVKGAIGAYAGGHIGKYFGEKVGEPGAGETIGNLVGGAAGAMGKRIPTSIGSMAHRFLTAGEEAAGGEAAAGTRLRPLTPAPGPAIAPIEEPSRIITPEHYPGPRERIRLTPFEGAGEAAPAAAPGSRLQPIAPGAARSPRGYFNPGRGEPIRLEPIVNEAMGVKPLKPDVPLREQLTKTTAIEPAEIDPIKLKYPDPQVRQMVRANGERLYEAAKHDPNLIAKVHDLTRVDLRQALINSGEDMGQTTVSNSKFAGQGSISREEAFNKLLDKGHKPEDILRLAKIEPKDLAYRVHDVGTEPHEMDIERSHAHATTNRAEAEAYQKSRGGEMGPPQKISPVDLSKLKEGTDYARVKGPNGKDWIKFLTRPAKAVFE
jgi:hypothetical protein